MSICYLSVARRLPTIRRAHTKQILDQLHTHTKTRNGMCIFLTATPSVCRWKRTPANNQAPTQRSGTVLTVRLKKSGKQILCEMAFAPMARAGQAIRRCRMVMRQRRHYQKMMILGGCPVSRFSFFGGSFFGK
jgi:hypothetical protein